MSFQYSGVPLPASMQPAPDTFPAVLAKREYVDIPRGLTPTEEDRAKRRISRKVLDAFWLDMGFAHYSGSMQINAGHPLHDWYMEQARANRERVEAHRRNAKKTAKALQVSAVCDES